MGDLGCMPEALCQLKMKSSRLITWSSKAIETWKCFRAFEFPPSSKCYRGERGPEESEASTRTLLLNAGSISRSQSWFWMLLEDINCLGSHEKALTGVVTIQCAENLLIPKEPENN